MIVWFLPGCLLLLLNDLSSWPDVTHLWLMKAGLSHCLSFIHFKTNKCMAEWWWWGREGKRITLAEGMAIHSLYFPQTGWAHRGKNTWGFHTRGSISEFKHLKEPPPERSSTCSFVAQGHPDYLTACAASKAIHLLVIKPVSSCLL